MQRNLLTLFASVLLLGGLTPVRAEAGALTESIDLVSITPMVGVEVAQIGTAGLGSSGSVLLRGFNVAPALTYGGIAGVRLGPIGLGILVQHTQGVKSLDDSDVSMTKVYGQFSVQIPFDKIVGVFHVDFGWAGLATQGLLTHGLGGKIGLALDYYPARWISLGAGADFDAQSYRTSTEMVGGYGGTFVGRVGLHL